MAASRTAAPRKPASRTAAPRNGWRALPGLDLATGLVALLLVVNLLAVWGMVTARREARAAIREGQALETRADARTFEALLVRQHRELEFLAEAAPLSSPRRSLAGDPVAQRWARLDAEGTLLRYLQANPAVVELRLRGQDGVRAAAGRAAGEGGVPLLLHPDQDEPADGAALLRASWPVDPDAPDSRLEAWVDPLPLLATVGPGLRLRRNLQATSEAAAAAAESPVEAVSSAVWEPPFEAFLERIDGDSEVAGAVERLADRYRTTLLLNVALLPLSLLVGVVTFRRVRRLARLESEREQQERLRALERQVQHNERLASLGRFAAGIAHEINNPLEGMANYLQLLREDLEAGNADQAADWLPRLDEGIERVAGTVRQVLHFAEPGRGAREAVDLTAVLERTVSFLQGHPDCRDAVIHLRCPPGLTLEGDRVTLGQLALNLVLNACQAQPEDGEVEVVARLTEGVGTEAVELQVLDRGPGFAPDEAGGVSRLFEPFHSTRGSTGLGLAVCRGIVIEHGGVIEARNRADGPGAELWVRLPRSAAAQEAAS